MCKNFFMQHEHFVYNLVINKATYIGEPSMVCYMTNTSVGTTDGTDGQVVKWTTQRYFETIYKRLF